MKNKPGMNYLILFIALLLSGCTVKRSGTENSSIEVNKIWGQAPHSAFTDLIRYKNAFYCAFREGPDHVSGPSGTARVLKSADGKDWESIASFKLENLDIRDPKLSVTPDNRIMVLMDVESYNEGKVATRKPYVSFSDGSGSEFSEPLESEVDPAIAVKSDWVWRVTWHDGVGYAIDYQPNGIYLLKTDDGRSFRNVSRLAIDGSPNEATIRFDKKGKMYVLIRREEADRMGILAVSEAPYQEWTFNKLDQRLGGPNFIFLNDSTLAIGSRQYPAEGSAGNDGPKTSIFLADTKGKIFKTIQLPSGGDTSYPGMLIYKDEMWVSYYSSHEEKTSIYLAKIPLSQLQK